MPAAVVAAAATIGLEAIGFAISATATWSWSAVLAKAAFSAAVPAIGESLCDPPPEFSIEHP